MKIFNVDMEKELWHRMEIKAAIQGKSLKDYIINALRSALDDPDYRPEYKQASNILIRKNIRVPQELWSRTCIAAAKFDVSKRDYLSSVIDASLAAGKQTYPIGEEVIIVDPIALSPEARDYIIRAGDGKFAAGELVTRFAEGLHQKDYRLMDWLADQLK